MQKEHDLNEALQCTTSQTVRGQQSPNVAAQSTDNPLQQYMLAGQLHNVTLASPVGTRPQLITSLQGIRIAGSQATVLGSPGQSPPQPLRLHQGGTRLLSPVGSPTGYTPSPSTPHGAISPGSAASPLQRQLSTPAGLLVLPSMSPTHGFQLASQSSPSLAPARLLIQQTEAGGSELQIVQSSPQAQGQQHLPSSMIHQQLPVSTVSASGGTIHHIGQSPTRGGIPPLANPSQHQASMNLQQQLQSAQGLVPQAQTASAQLQQVAARRMSASSASGLSPGSAKSPTSTVIQHPLAVQTLNKSPLQSPERPKKRIKLETVDPPSDTVGNYRRLICEERLRQLNELKENYTEHMTELFYLQNSGNVMDYHVWKKKQTPQLKHFLQTSSIDSDDEDASQEMTINDEVIIITTSGGTTPLATPVAISTQLPPAVTAMQQHQQQHANQEQSRILGGRHGIVFAHAVPTTQSTAATSAVTTLSQGTTVASTPPRATTSASSVASSAPTLTSQLSKNTVESAPKAIAPSIITGGADLGPGVKAVKSPLSPTRLGTRQHAISAVYDNTIGSQEAIVERAKQEAQVMQRVAELRKEGLWSSRRLPKVQECSRNKAHWDYLLEEMQWLAADFAQERKWKKAGCRKIARMINKYFQEKQLKEIKAEKEEANKTKKIASNLAKMVREFWNNIEKVVQFKQQSRLDEKRKRALDLHLSFIVDQTEKYSSWLTEGLKGANSIASSSPAGSVASPLGGDDADFEPMRDESDDEETIIKAEEEMEEENTEDEVNALCKESEIPLDELLKTLPKEVLEKPASLDPSDASSDTSGESDQEANKADDEFEASDEEIDDEETLDEQEDAEQNVDHQEELKELEAENEMSVEELRKKYAAAYDPEFEAQMSRESTATELDSDDDDDDEEEAETEGEDTDNSDSEEAGEDFGMDYLYTSEAPEEPSTSQTKQTDVEGPNKEITDIAATAESLQPTGYTLQTTKVQTAVPFLLKHKLREYQHVGLDWLATMHERRLNGILADEMGLGKTIQTIALLAHLACEKGVWGPHLIVVPTSVMLNWEMEIKKWCPAFKILTYYGNQKERKLKRTGWTKTNAFHVCITSYKLVIQDHQSFRRKKWKYFILDEAQNIKNFKSQRWQTLLNFSSQRRLLLTGTPLQNSLMELWSLMHFLMPHVFQSHREFKEWFANPLSGMVEGSQEYNEGIIKRLHKVLRPFLLRRLKMDVEKQMPKKYEHVVMCRLSKRQRFLYDDFMSQTKTKETLASGHYMSVINILMQLRKVCNHPNLFDPRPIVSPFQMEGLTYTTASLVLRALEKDPLQYLAPTDLHPSLTDLELQLPAFAAHRVKKLQCNRPLIVEIDDAPEPAPRLKPVDDPRQLQFRSSPMTGVQSQSGRSSPFVPISQRTSSPILSRIATGLSRANTPTSSLASVVVSKPVSTTPSVTATQLQQLPGHSLVAASQDRATPLTQTATLSTATTSGSQPVFTSQPITVQIQHTQQGTKLMIPPGQLSQLPPGGFIHIVQTSAGQQIVTAQPTSQIVTATAQASQSLSSASVINGPSSSGQAAGLANTTASGISTVPLMSTSTSTVVLAPAARQLGTTVQLPSGASGLVAASKPVMRVSPLATSTVSMGTSLVNPSVTQMAKTGATTTLTSATKSNVMSRSTDSKAREQRKQEAKKSELYLESLAEKRAADRRQTLKRLASVNKTNCELKPVYGQDLVETVIMFGNKHLCTTWNGSGYFHCHNVQSQKRHSSANIWHHTEALHALVRTPEEYMAELEDILNRYAFVTPSVSAPVIGFHCHHPPPSWLQEHRTRRTVLHQDLSPRMTCLHKISTGMTVQFPELRLIQYDCGKLQTMDALLRRLKTGHHRVLIFTQMTKMLDVLEAFLNYHGHRYLRLDGTTKVEQRQILMDRFNMDKRIFCFILSTRSGGLGVNLTGADTVIFYDSDWNPTMDAQAQDRCHRIGQTRDVHIYRLISEKTIEENIVKKANQKRLLGDVAIEGGNFTTAFFKEHTIKELFEEPSGLQNFAKEQVNQEKLAATAKATAKAIADTKELGSGDAKSSTAITAEQMEQALCQAEDETDVQAAKVVHAEQKAELAEFDENIPWDEREAEAKKEKDDEFSKVEQELSMLDKELTPVERYAVFYLENQMAPFSTEELQKAEEEVTIAKEEWELSRLQELKEEEERRAEMEEDEMLYTCSREDAYNQVYICDETGEHMPMWCPPTPPQDDNDVYIDQTLNFMYEPAVMPESQLPPVYIKKEPKHKVRVDHPGAQRKHKVRKEDQHRVPRSLFDRHTSLLRRDVKLAKIKQGLIKPIRPTPMLQRPMLDGSHDQPEWLIHEDWALLQAVQMLLELPLSLSNNSPAQIPNWDLVAEVVNASSRTYRSPKQCKNRYENVIVPREEGKILYDINPRKQKKSRGIYKTKNNRPMRTSQLFCQDNNNAGTTLFTFRFDSCKNISSKRTPTLRPSLVNPTLKNPKHAAVLADNGINYDSPLTPIQVAQIRAERIAKEKKNQQAEQQLAAAQRAAAQQAHQAASGQRTTVTPTVVGTTAGGQVTIVQGPTGALPVATAAATNVVAAALQKAGTTATPSLARSLGVAGSIVVNAPGGVPGQPFATINRRMTQATTGTITQVTNVTATQARRPNQTPMTVHELSAAVANQSRVAPAVAALGTSHVITTTTLPAQLVAASRGVTVTSTTVAGTVPQQLTSKALTPQQLQQLRQQALRQQQQQQQQKRLAGITAVQAPKAASGTQATLKQTTLSRPLTDQEVTILRRQQLQNQKVLAQSTGTTQVHQVQTTQGLPARFTNTQIIAAATGSQLQQVQGQSGGAQSIATLVKTVASSSAVPTGVTIPVMSNVNISVSMPQQKGVTVAKGVTQNQIRQIQLQQLQQRRLQQAHKVPTLTTGQLQLQQAAKGGQLIIQQATGGLSNKISPAVLQQLVRSQQQPGGIQQIITSVAPQTTTATVIATQLVNQAQPSTKTSSVVAALTQARSTPTTVTAVPISSAGASLVTQTVSGAVVTTQVPSTSSITPTVTLTAAPALGKHEVIVSPQKFIPTQANATVAQQIKAQAQLAARQLNTTRAGTTATIPMTPQAIAVATSQRAPASAQAAVQQIQAQAQHQAAQRVVTSSTAGVAHHIVSTPTVATTNVIPQQTQIMTSPPNATVQHVPVTQIQTPSGGTATQGTPQGQDAQSRTPYGMRLRNTQK